MGVETKQKQKQKMAKAVEKKRPEKRRRRPLFLAICCKVPGEAMASSTGICVQEKEILKDVLNVWARGLLQGRSLPSEARVLSIVKGKEFPLDVRKPLQLLRQSLPVQRGHYTVTVIMPKEAFQPAEPVSPTLKAKDAGARSSFEKTKAVKKDGHKSKMRIKDKKDKDTQKPNRERTATMYMFHRLLSLVTMMYNEHDQLTMCDFVRPKQRRQIQRDRSKRHEEREVEEPEPKEKTVPKAKAAKAKPKAKAAQ
eukprot:symbB.v1.2.000506.t1/scaffold31.1/size418471/2